MGWTETCAVDERMRFVIAAEKQEDTFAAVCRQFGVSRRTGYKVARYEETGVAGLVDHSRAPHCHPQALPAAIIERCLWVRRSHPSWGPVKVRAWLERHDVATPWPAASTIGALFDREGLTVKRRLRRRSPPSSAPFAHCEAANDVWCMDFKGWFLTGDGRHCEPLTLSDAHSRYLLRCQAMARTDTDHVWPVLNAAFREFGLPHRLRSDNGPPFASRGRRLSRGSEGDQAGSCRSARARQAATERPAGAAASDVAAGYRQAAGAEPREQLERCASQRLTTTSARIRLSATTPRPSITQLATTLRRCSRAPDYGATTPCGGCAPTARSSGWATDYINEALAGEPIGRSRTPTETPLTMDRSRSASSRIAAIAAQTLPSPWTCGQRCALPTGSTARTTTIAERNKTGNVLPMSPVRTVTI